MNSSPLHPFFGLLIMLPVCKWEPVIADSQNVPLSSQPTAQIFNKVSIYPQHSVVPKSSCMGTAVILARTDKERKSLDIHFCEYFSGFNFFPKKVLQQGRRGRSSLSTSSSKQFVLPVSLFMRSIQSEYIYWLLQDTVPDQQTSR